MKAQVIFFLLIITIFANTLNAENAENAEHSDKIGYWKHLLNSQHVDATALVRNQIDSLVAIAKADVEIYSTALQGLMLLNDPKDSLFIEEIRNQIIEEFPSSDVAFDLASNEFYDRLYPVWNNDSLKVDVFVELLDKYNDNNWRRTIYHYYAYSLKNLSRNEELNRILTEFRHEFTDDYLPFYLSAIYLKTEVNIEQQLEFAETAFALSKTENYLDFYGEEQWALELRSAPIKTANILAEIYRDSGKSDSAIELLLDVVAHYSPGVEDETSLGRIYLQLAITYNKLDDKDNAINACIQALVCGDSRNIYTPRADSLLKEIADISQQEDILSFARRETDYNDVLFSDITDSIGLSDIHAGRVAWGDYDNDGFDDLLLNGSRLFHNSNGKAFNEVTDIMIPDNHKANGAIWADLNNDGWLDFISKDKEAVLINKGSYFEYSGQDIDNGISTEGLGIADFDNDGNMDFYLANYEDWNDGNSLPKADQLFLGSGDGYFDEIPDSIWITGKPCDPQAGRGVSIADFDEDGDQDIFVANYRLNQNFLWVNDGNASFRNEALHRGVAGVEVDGWWGHTIGAEWADFDNDGDLDLITCNLAHPRYLDFSNKTMLYVNSGAPDYLFTDIRASSGIRFEETNSDPAWGDFDCDGNLDLYITNVYEGRRSFLYMSNGDGTFRDVTYLSGTRHFNGWGSALSDFDNDGDLDILVAGGAIQLLRNDSKRVGKSKMVYPNEFDSPSPIGRIVKFKDGNRIITRFFQGGKGTTNQHSMRLHFGLADDM